MGLTKLAITRPVFILMLMVGFILAGYTSFKAMRQEENPEVQFGAITISTVYPGAGPDEINTLISRKVEQAVSGVGGLLSTTASSQEGVSVVALSFEIGTNMDAALSDVRAKVDSIKAELPTEVLPPTVSKLDSASDPIMEMSIASDKLNPQELRDLADQTLQDRFASIKGVAQVTVSGGEQREIRVLLDKNKLLSFGVGIADVQRALANTNLNVPAGHITGPNQEYGVRVIGEFKTLDDIRNTTIRVSDPNDPDNAASFKVGDIAEVKDTSAEKRVFSRVNGQDAVLMTIQKTRDGNAIEVASGAKAAIKQIEQQYGVKFTITTDSSDRVKESLEDVMFALCFGILLVCLIVYIFLHNLRGTIIVAIAIPVCLMATLWVLRMLGFTINNMTMLALSLAIGVLVDDAIVVLENIYRHLRMGEDPVNASINGRSEIGLAAIAITFVDIVVFLPMGFMGGVVGQFFRPLGIAFAVAVFMSLMVSFTVTPMLASRWYKEGEDVEHFEGGFAGWFEKRFSKFAAGYGRALEWALNHRWWVFSLGFIVLLSVFSMLGGSMSPNMGVAIGSSKNNIMMVMVVAVVAFIVTAIAQRQIRLRILWGAALLSLLFPIAAGVGFMYGQWKQSPLFTFTFAPTTDQGKVSVKIETAPGSSLTQTLAVVEDLEKIAMKQPDAEYVVSQTGTWSGSFGGAGGSTGTNLAQITVTLRDKKALLDSILMKPGAKSARTNSNSTTAASLTKDIGRVPGARVSVSIPTGFGAGPALTMSFTSDNRELLDETMRKITDRLNQGAVPGVINVDVSSKPGKPEFRAIPDPERMADANVTTADIAASLSTLYEGNDDVKFRQNGQEYPIRVMMSEKDRTNQDLLSSVPIKFSQGDPIFLPQTAKIIAGTTVDKINRFNRQEQVTISADLLPGYVPGSVQDQITKMMTDEKLVPEGVVYKPLGQTDIQNREMVYLMSTLFLGLALTYMLLASLYDNLVYPFIIQLAQPMAFVGALLALIVTDKSLNIVGFIGLIALVGLVGKNAILLVDYTNTLRARGKNRHDALVEAGPTRLRPITMTTSAVVLGMLPVALAIGRGSEFRETMGITIIGGILLSTLLTLFVIPCSYTIFDDLSRRIGKWRGHDEDPHFAGSETDFTEPMAGPGEYPRTQN